MRSQKETLKIMEISTAIQTILDNKDALTDGDFQGCLEAQVMNAIDYGKNIGGLK
jgi:hypothetical protein